MQHPMAKQHGICMALHVCNLHAASHSTQAALMICLAAKPSGSGNGESNRLLNRGKTSKLPERNVMLRISGKHATPCEHHVVWQWDAA